MQVRDAFAAVAREQPAQPPEGGDVLADRKKRDADPDGTLDNFGNAQGRDDAVTGNKSHRDSAKEEDKAPAASAGAAAVSASSAAASTTASSSAAAAASASSAAATTTAWTYSNLLYCCCCCCYSYECVRVQVLLVQRCKQKREEIMRKTEALRTAVVVRSSRWL